MRGIGQRACDVANRHVRDGEQFPRRCVSDVGENLFILARQAITGLDASAIAVAVLLILLRYKIDPALLVLGAAAIGLIAF
jgi:hypothetical protein